MRPLGKIKLGWSPKMAYVVGLIATDGCLYKDGRHLSLTTKDRDLAIIFSRCLGIKVKFGKKTSGYTGKGDCLHVQFGDVLFYRWLLGIGLTPNKSKTISRLKIPDQYFFDFLRGCFDGDGSIYAYWDPRWKSSYMFYIQFASASKPFLDWLQTTIYRLVGIAGKVKPMRSRAFQLVFAKNNSIRLASRMYHSPRLPALRRKLAKVRGIIRINERHNQISARVL